MIVYDNKIAIDINGTIDEVYYTVTDVIDKKPFPMLDEKYSTMEDAVADLKEKEGEE